MASTEDFIIDTFSGGCKPSDKLGGGHSDSAIRGEAVSKKYFFSPLRASVWFKNKGEARAPQTPPLDPPLSLWYTKLVHRTKCVSHKALISLKSCHGYLISLFTVTISDLSCFDHFLYPSMSMRSPHVSSTVLMKTSEAFFHLLMTNDAFL